MVVPASTRSAAVSGKRTGLRYPKPSCCIAIRAVRCRRGSYGAVRRRPICGGKGWPAWLAQRPSPPAPANPAEPLQASSVLAAGLGESIGLSQQPVQLLPAIPIRSTYPGLTNWPWTMARDGAIASQPVRPCLPPTGARNPMKMITTLCANNTATPPPLRPNLRRCGTWA